MKNIDLNNSNPFLLNDFLGVLGEDFIKTHDWIFSDIDAYVLKDEEEMENNIFYKEKFYLTGDELLFNLNNFDILLVFGLVIAVKKEEVRRREVNFPKLLGNKDYWDVDYTSSITGQVIEIAFYDSSYIFISCKSEATIKKFLCKYPSFSEYTSSTFD